MDENIKMIERELIVNNKIKNPNTKLPLDSYDIIFIYANRLPDLVSSIFPPNNQYYLRTIINESGFVSEVVECTENNFISVFNSIKTKCNIFGFYCACDNEVVVTHMSNYIKKNCPDSLVFIGGPQAIGLHEQFFIESNADIVIEGEGEIALVDLLNHFLNHKNKLEDIGNIKYIKNGKMIKNHANEAIMDLDSYPFSKVKRKDVKRYNSARRIFVLTGRGCPNRCTFCYEGGNARKVRYRSMDCIFEEIEYLLKEFPLANLMHILDDTFTCNTDRVHEFCARMKKIRETRQIYWVCEAHVNTLWNRPDFLREMIDAGLVGFQIGIESGSSEILKSYKKNITPQMTKDVIDMCYQSGAYLSIEGNFILGGPYETKETIAESMELCDYLIEHGRGQVFLNVVSFYPLPNTEISNKPEQFGLSFDMSALESTIRPMTDIVTCSKTLTREEIAEEKRKFENRLREKYVYESLRLNKTEVMRQWNQEARQFNVNSPWGSVMNQYEHFVNYALYATIDNQNKLTFDLSIYPMRTFMSIDYPKVHFEPNNIFLSDIEIKVLNKCSGKFTAHEIAKQLGLDISTLKQILEKLENRCMIHYSLF